jgi:hypothetical protein
MPRHSDKRQFAKWQLTNKLWVEYNQTHDSGSPLVFGQLSIQQCRYQDRLPNDTLLNINQPIEIFQIVTLPVEIIWKYVGHHSAEWKLSDWHLVNCHCTCWVLLRHFYKRQFAKWQLTSKLWVEYNQTHGSSSSWFFWRITMWPIDIWNFVTAPVEMPRQSDKQHPTE